MIDRTELNEIDEVVKKTVLELKCNIVEKDPRTPYQKTESILYNYYDFLTAIQYKEQLIEGMQNEEHVEVFARSITVTKSMLTIIDEAITALKDNKYFEILKMMYFEKKTQDEVGDYYGVNHTTIGRNRNKMIKSIQDRLFCDESIARIFS